MSDRTIALLELKHSVERFLDEGRRGRWAVFWIMLGTIAICWLITAKSGPTAEMGKKLEAAERAAAKYQEYWEVDSARIKSKQEALDLRIKGLENEHGTR